MEIVCVLYTTILVCVLVALYRQWACCFFFLLRERQFHSMSAVYVDIVILFSCCLLTVSVDAFVVVVVVFSHIIHYILILSRVILQLNIDNIPYGSLLFRAIFDFQTLLLLLVSCNSVAVLNPHTRIRKMRNKQMFRSGTPKLTVRRIKEVEMKANTQKAAWKPMHEDKKANTRKKQQNSSRHKRRVERQKKPQDVAL